MQKNIWHQCKFSISHHFIFSRHTGFIIPQKNKSVASKPRRQNPQTICI